MARKSPPRGPSPRRQGSKRVSDTYFITAAEYSEAFMDLDLAPIEDRQELIAWVERQFARIVQQIARKSYATTVFLRRYS